MTALESGARQARARSALSGLSFLLVLTGAVLIAVAATWFVAASGARSRTQDAGYVPGDDDVSSIVSESAPPSPRATLSMGRPSAPARKLAPVVKPTPVMVVPLARKAARPLELRIAEQAVDAQVVGVKLNAGKLGVPSDPGVLGWWSASAKPGSQTGSVVIDGHVDTQSQGKGALFQLASLRMGATVDVITTAGRVSYKVVGRRVYDKADLPAKVFRQTGSPRLVLITCGGPFDQATRHYRDNIVVYAVPV